MGNDIAGGKVTPALEVYDFPPTHVEVENCFEMHPNLCGHSCSITKNDEIALSNTVLVPIYSGETTAETERTVSVKNENDAPMCSDKCYPNDFSIPEKVW